MKLVCEKIGIPLKKDKETVKTRMGNSTGNTHKKKSTKTGQNGKTKRSWNMWAQNAKDNTGKNNCSTWGNKQERGEIKRYRQRVKQYRQNRTFQNNERKFYQQLGGHDTKTYLQSDAKETEQFWTKIWQPKSITKRLNG